MAIRDENTTTQQQQQAPAPGQQPTESMGQNQGWSFLSMGSAGMVSRNMTNEALAKTTKALEESIKGISDLDKGNFKISVIPIDRTKETSLYLSGVAVCVAIDKTNVAYHVLLLEASNDPLTAVTETVMGKPTLIDRPTSEVYNKAYMEVAQRIVEERFTGAHMVQGISGQVVPRTFNIEDKTALDGLTKNALLPCTTYFYSKSSNGFQENLANRKTDSQLQVNIEYSDQDVSDYVGLPVRNAVQMYLSAVSTQRVNQNQINSSQQSVRVARVGGFVDLYYNPVESQYVPYQAQPLPSAKYTARFVLTNMEHLYNITLPQQLLTLATSMAFTENTNWYSYFRARHNNAGRTIDLRDVGAINIEANIKNETDKKGYGSRIDTKLSTFDESQLGFLLRTAIRPGMVLSLDVSDCGSDTWYNEPFSAAANGSPAAIQEIIDAANTLTNNNFSRFYQGNMNPVLQDGEPDRVHLGYYIGKNGEKRDIREIDYLAITNAVGDTNPESIKDWSDTYVDNHFPLALRLAGRKKMIESVIGSEVTYTGFARRITFHKDFVEALLKACAAVGFDPRLISPDMGVNYQSQRATYGAIAQSAIGAQASGIFQQGYANQSTGYNYGGMTNRASTRY
jgi:hypothetical protein